MTVIDCFKKSVLGAFILSIYPCLDWLQESDRCANDHLRRRSTTKQWASEYSRRMRNDRLTSLAFSTIANVPVPPLDVRFAFCFIGVWTCEPCSLILGKNLRHEWNLANITAQMLAKNIIFVTFRKLFEEQTLPETSHDHLNAVYFIVYDKGDCNRLLYKRCVDSINPLERPALELFSQWPFIGTKWNWITFFLA